jgi:hypothetical protein
MKQFAYHVVQTARDGIDTLDAERRRQGISQMRISELADTPDVGQWYARMYGRGDVMLSKYLRFLRATGYELVMVKKEDLDSGG